MTRDEVRLTTLVKCAGWASKVGLADLAHVLRQLPRFDDPRIVVGSNLADDAAVYQLREDFALVQTVDFFTPVVDDPYTFGQIAAANSLSDVYAIGGQPMTALNIVVFPTKTLPAEILGEILRGGAGKAREAGVSIVGGHTVDGDEPTYGLSVVGTVDPRRIVRTSAGQTGDVLILTKPLGTGVIATALKAGAAEESHVAEAVSWMTRLNREASEAMLEAGAHAATDITGFGLLGHLVEMARSSGLAAEIDLEAVPFMTGAARYAVEGFVPAGGRSNAEYVAGSVQWPSDISDAHKRLLADPQTSGGLLIAIGESEAQALIKRLEGEGDLAASVGSLTVGAPGTVLVR